VGHLRATQGAPLPSDIPAFDSLAEGYIAYTGDAAFRDLTKARVVQIFNTATFAGALGSTLSRLLIKDFATEYRWRDIVTETTSPPDFRTQERVRLRHIGDLAQVGEDEPYEEVPAYSDEKVSYAVTQWGRTLTITRRAFLTDDVGGIKRSVEMMGRAAWRTLAKRVWGKVINNDIYDADGLPIFHTDHGNLGSAALSVASLTAARAAIFAQTEPGSDERLGLSDPFLLAIPIEVESTARPINTCEYIPGSVTYEGNPWYHRFGAEGERLFVNPLFADASDWYLFDISGNVGIIEVGFLHGRQMPELFFANDDRVGAMHAADRLLYKIRHEYEAEILDYRGAYKSVVT
jgi:hypothetical protein